jgi:G:T/U-mismatch repair DNA glycosylase
MITKHLYIDQYPIPPESRKLILGTIHPHESKNFRMPFFYGNKNSIWHLLSDAFPEELPAPITVAGVRKFLDKRKIAVSDTIRECRRTDHTALDTSLIPTLLNYGLTDQIRASEITHILCTSGFGKNNAFRLFYKDILGLNITEEIRKARQVLLDPEIFGRQVLLSVLYSPSGAANISLSKNPAYLAAMEQYKGTPRPVYDFKVAYYREQFSAG